jgi:hypothetical protein
VARNFSTTAIWHCLLDEYSPPDEGRATMPCDPRQFH